MDRQNDICVCRTEELPSWYQKGIKSGFLFSADFPFLFLSTESESKNEIKWSNPENGSSDTSIKGAVCDSSPIRCKATLTDYQFVIFPAYKTKQFRLRVCGNRITYFAVTHLAACEMATSSTSKSKAAPLVTQIFHIRTSHTGVILRNNNTEFGSGVRYF